MSRGRAKAVRIAIARRDLWGFLAYTNEGFLEPSVAQPPLPLQLFLPLQPWSLVEQPPVPLQSFLPLQECLAGGVLSWLASIKPAVVPETFAMPFVAALAATDVPPTRPESAAVRSIAFIWFLVMFF